MSVVRTAGLAVLVVSLAFLVSVVAAEPPGFETLSAELVANAVRLRDEARQGSDAYKFLSGLTTEVGPRFAGTEGDRRGVDWARARLEAMGLEAVRAESVEVPRWERGMAAGRILEPFPQSVVVAALGGSVATPVGGTLAEVVEVGSLEALAELPREKVEGKIVFFNRKMRRTRDGSGYGEAVPVRTQGAARAGALGAKAVLIRSIGTSSHRFAHTGTTRYDKEGPKIPAAALSNPDADLLAAQIATGRRVLFRLEIGSRELGPAESANVIGEIRGRERPEEVVLLAAHLDSWDLGTGAIDDGIGCAVISEAVSWIARHAPRPRRTIRVLLAANEEFGLSGARDYAERYGEEIRHTAALESDFGVGPVWALRSRVEAAAMPLVRDLTRLLEPLGVTYQGNEAFGGADLSPLQPRRIPLFDLPLEAETYFDYHHSPDDTLDKVDAADLRQAVAAYAVAAWVLAETEVDLGLAPEPQK